MKKAFANYAALCMAAIILLSLTTLLAFGQRAAAQGGGGGGMGVMSGPIELASNSGQRIQYNVAEFCRGTGVRGARTTLDLYADVMSPTGPETIRQEVSFSHNLDASGKVSRISIVQNGDNLDLYLDGVLTQPQMLNGLPPGEPVVDFVVNSHTTAFDLSVFMTGTTEVLAPDGHTIVAWKSHELTGNVTLIK